MLLRCALKVESWKLIDSVLGTVAEDRRERKRPCGKVIMHKRAQTEPKLTRMSGLSHRLFRWTTTHAYWNRDHQFSWFRNRPRRRCTNNRAHVDDNALTVPEVSNWQSGSDIEKKVRPDLPSSPAPIAIVVPLSGLGVTDSHI